MNTRDIPKTYTKRRFYLPEEVSEHCTANDCWVSIFNEVFDLTELIQLHYSALTDPLVKAAGTDISHWFNPKTKEVYN